MIWCPVCGQAPESVFHMTESEATGDALPSPASRRVDCDCGAVVVRADRTGGATVWVCSPGGGPVCRLQVHETGVVAAFLGKEPVDPADVLDLMRVREVMSS